MGRATLRPHYVACSPAWATIRLPMSQRTSTAHSFKRSSVSCCPLPPSRVVTASTRRRASGCSASGICFKKHFGRSNSHRRMKSRARRGCGLLQRLCTLSWSLHLGPRSAGLLPRLGGQKVRGSLPTSGVRREATVGVCRSGREIPGVGRSALAHKRFCWLMVMPTKISARCRRYLDQRVSPAQLPDVHLLIRIRYYVLRDDMLAFYISDLRVRLSKNEHGCWEVSTTSH
jgi:hypothetical protein